MKCNNCGKEIANDSKFCEFCGKKIQAEGGHPSWIFPIICGIITIAVCIGAVILVISYDKKIVTAEPQKLEATNDITEIAEKNAEKEKTPSKDLHATLCVDKMNVLYAGFPNPVSLEGGGVGNYSVDIPGCTVKTTGQGKYDVTVPYSLIGKKVEATLSSSDGSFKKEFRVKKVPDPTSFLGANIWGGKRSKSELLANPFVSARMGEDFAYDIKWTVNSYRLTVISKGIEGAPMECSGGQFNNDVTSAIQNAGSGTVLVFSHIEVSSSVGQRTLRDITVRIK